MRMGIVPGAIVVTFTFLHGQRGFRLCLVVDVMKFSLPDLVTGSHHCPTRSFSETALMVVEFDSYLLR